MEILSGLNSEVISENPKLRAFPYTFKHYGSLFMGGCAFMSKEKNVDRWLYTGTWKRLMKSGLLYYGQEKWLVRKGRAWPRPSWLNTANRHGQDESP